ncbi:hypothetical protein MLD38_020843 [Melastoma candidum]|uniref:Uncharacterized protein n=1 Tax=Melastoma candidum TaxID=119954 RepID=A0ACB9QG36_9MYRT|nr:hypothetical protein MLD38_020843 [Melastoma candidum]
MCGFASLLSGKQSNLDSQKRVVPFGKKHLVIGQGIQSRDCKDEFSIRIRETLLGRYFLRAHQFCCRYFWDPSFFQTPDPI